MKFKIGDTVYLKAVVDDIKDHVIKGIRCNLGYEVGYTHCEDYHLFTKQEMLKELQKPEMPKVGEVWKCSDIYASMIDEFKIFYIDEETKQAAIKSVGDDKNLRIMHLDFVLDHCEKVESVADAMAEQWDRMKTLEQINEGKGNENK